MWMKIFRMRGRCFNCGIYREAGWCFSGKKPWKTLLYTTEQSQKNNDPADVVPPKFVTEWYISFAQMSRK